MPALLEQSRAQGYEIKVALISAFEDLGVVTFLWKQPKPYADYLGAELSMVYKQRVLVVMPNGYGIYRLGHSGVREQRLLERLRPARKASAMLPRAIDAVRRLAAAQGVELATPDVKPPPGGVKQPQSHFEVGAREQVPQDVPARPQPSSVPASATTSRESSGTSGLLYAGPALVGLLMAGVVLTRRIATRRRTYSS